MVLAQLLGKNVFLELLHSSPNKGGSLADFLSGKEKKKTFQAKPCHTQLKGYIHYQTVFIQIISLSVFQRDPKITNC